MQEHRRKMRILRYPGVFVVLAMLACGPVLPCTVMADVSRAEAIVKDLRLQTELPKTEKVETTRKKVRISIPGWVSYLLVAAFAVLVIVTVAREMQRRGLTLDTSRQQKTPEADIKRIREAHAHGNIGDYIRRLMEELSASTDFAQAVHRMLIEAIAIIKPSLDFHLSDAFTSREVMDRLDLSPDREDNLAVIIEQVERSHFGGLDVSREQFERCLEAFRHLVGAREVRSHG